MFYPKFGAILIQTIKSSLGSQWTDEIEEAWDYCIQYIEYLSFGNSDFLHQNDMKLPETLKKRIKSVFASCQPKREKPISITEDARSLKNQKMESE